MFSDDDEYLDFAATIGPQVKKWVNMSERSFVAEMEKAQGDSESKKITVKFLEDDGKGGGLFLQKRKGSPAGRGRQESQRGAEGTSNAAKRRKKESSI